MTKRFLITIGIMGAFSVLLGAVGAHILYGNIPEKHMIMFNTANEFLMYHSLALLGLALLGLAFMNRYVGRSYLNTIYFLFVIGTVLFSGTLLMISLKEVIGFNLDTLGKLTPVGGLLLIIGWIVIIFAGITYKHKKRH